MEPGLRHRDTVPLFDGGGVLCAWSQMIDSSFDRAVGRLKSWGRTLVCRQCAASAGHFVAKWSLTRGNTTLSCLPFFNVSIVGSQATSPGPWTSMAAKVCRAADVDGRSCARSS